MDLKQQLDVSGLRSIVYGIANRPLILMLIGGVMIASAAFSLFGSSAGARDSEMALQQGRRAVAQLVEPVESLRRLLRDEQVQSMAAMSLEDESTLQDLKGYLQGRVQDIQEVQIFEPNFPLHNANELGDSGYVILDMLFATAKGGLAPVQLLKQGDGMVLAAAAAIGEPESPTGFVYTTSRADTVLADFEFPLPEAGYIALVQGSGGADTTTIREFGTPDTENYLLTRLAVPGSLLRVVIPQAREATGPSNFQRLIFFLIGGLLLAFGLIRRQVMLRSPVEFKPDPEALAGKEGSDGGAEGDAGFAAARLEPAQFEADPAGALPVPTEPSHPTGHAGEQGAPVPAAPDAASDGEIPSFPPIGSAEYSTAAEEDTESAGAAEAGAEDEPAPEVDLAELHYELEQRQRHRQVKASPVELSSEIFRAYDIRGVVGKSLDQGVARQVGQAVGSLALEREATPVVVGRDGRHSGPDLVDGMVEGLQAAGCEVIDVGAVPTGALYFASYELGSGSGVMVTGSHNPPDYNGFKIMIGGETLAGEAITALYENIVSGSMRVGKGEVRGEEILNRYRDRIASDIQLQRPLKVVADCGNGIGGVCAAEVLRAIGAEVLPLFDDVDGNFPNHHPDPSEPENLQDLIESVKLMEADLGVAFDGDADRLGVVTPSGRIIYSDRVMMLFAREVLSRNPGKTIIYDVKCTGHLPTVISEAGGHPEMWKTGHSLIKNRMKEVEAPFAGEMSGHFFFEDRWYGFDCGIYSAARLFEILAADEREPEEVMNELPDSVSTPELKVQLEEGENHAFILEFQEQAEFPGAEISTIDGLRADFPNGWGLVRASNTTPVLVLRFDADDQDSLNTVQEVFREQLLAIRDDLDLPF